MLTEREEFERAERVRAAMKKIIEADRMGSTECLYRTNGICCYSGETYFDMPYACGCHYGKPCWVGEQ